MLRYISLVLTCLFLSATTAMAQSMQKNYDTFITLEKGDTLKKQLRQDTIEAIDPVTYETHWSYPTTSIFHKLNDAPIYKYAQVKKPARKFLRGDVQKVLERKLRKDIQEAWNFFGHVELIISEEGDIVYSDVNLYPTDLSGTTSKPVDKEKSDLIRNNITQKLSAMHFRPAKKDGKKVAYHAIFY